MSKGKLLTRNIILSAIGGFLVWLILKVFLNAGIVSLICLIGYPVIFIGIIGSILYMMNVDLW